MKLKPFEIYALVLVGAIFVWAAWLICPAVYDYTLWTIDRQVPPPPTAPAPPRPDMERVIPVPDAPEQPDDWIYAPERQIIYI
jgi:hypothetical protein